MAVMRSMWQLWGLRGSYGVYVAGDLHGSYGVYMTVMGST